MAKRLQPQDDGKLQELLNERAMHKARLDELVDDYASGLLNREQFARAKARTEDQVAQIDTSISGISIPSVEIYGAHHTMKEKWEESPTDWRRSLIQLVVSRVLVDSGTAKPLYQLDSGQTVRFAPDLIRIEWIV